MLQVLAALNVMRIVEEFLGLIDTMRCAAVCKGLPSGTTWSDIKSRLGRRSIVVAPRFARSFGVHVQALFNATIRPLLELQTHPHAEEIGFPQELQGRQVFVCVRGYKRHRWVTVNSGMTLFPTQLLAFFRNPAMDNALRNLQSDGSTFTATEVVTYHERDNTTVKVKRCRLQAIVMGFQVDIVQRVFYPVGNQLPDSDAER